MKGIIITGKQGVGKTELARLIASTEDDIEISCQEDIKYITSETKVIIVEELDAKRNLDLFKELLTKTELTFRPLYARKEVTIDCSKMLLIGTSIDPIKDAINSFVYNLVYL